MTKKSVLMVIAAVLMTLCLTGIVVILAASLNAWNVAIVVGISLGQVVLGAAAGAVFMYGMNE